MVCLYGTIKKYDIGVVVEVAADGAKRSKASRALFDIVCKAHTHYRRSSVRSILYVEDAAAFARQMMKFAEAGHILLCDDFKVLLGKRCFDG